MIISEHLHAAQVKLFFQNHHGDMHLLFCLSSLTPCCHSSLKLIFPFCLHWSQERAAMLTDWQAGDRAVPTSYSSHSLAEAFLHHNWIHTGRSIHGHLCHFWLRWSHVVKRKLFTAQGIFFYFAYWTQGCDFKTPSNILQAVPKQPLPCPSVLIRLQGPANQCLLILMHLLINT